MNILKNSAARFARWRDSKANRAARRRARRGSTGFFMAIASLPMICLGGLGVDVAYRNYRYQLLQQTAQAAALAAEQNLYTYYTSGATTSLLNSVLSVVGINMPAAHYGTVIPASNVVPGTWDTGTNSFTATTTNPNAVQVSASETINTFFGSLVGLPTISMSTSAVASYGNGIGTAMGFNTIILNDLSMSFSSEIGDQRSIDAAILNCIATGTSAQGKVGITGISGHASTLKPLQTANAANVTSMTTYINHTLNYCGKSGMPSCSGSNAAAGLYSAVSQLLAAGIANSSSNIIIITDGVPNADSLIYTAADGTVTPTLPNPLSSYPRAVQNAVVTIPICLPILGLCTDANFLTAAQNQVALARALGINISTIYYTGDTNPSTLIPGYEAELASWVTGNGQALVAPRTTVLDSQFAQFCTSMGSAIKTVSTIH